MPERYRYGVVWQHNGNGQVAGVETQFIHARPNERLYGVWSAPNVDTRCRFYESRRGHVMRRHRTETRRAAW